MYLKTMIELTDTEILEDIEGFKKRIAKARERLSKLSESCLPYHEHKKREERARVLLDEIRHVEKLIQLARTAL